MNGRHHRLPWLIMAAMLFLTTSLHAQTVTKVFKNESLKTVLKEVERQTKMSVIYKTDEVNEYKRITATFNKATVNTVLNKILDSDLSYDVENRMITIHKRHATRTAEKPKTTQQDKNRQITGTVVDANGEPLIGVSVMVKGTSTGVVTNIDGNYTLNLADPDATLVFSYIGYTTQNVVAGNRSHLNVTMEEESNLLKEVVVTAMGIQRKESSLTYATQRVKAEDLMKVQDPNVANSLEGKISGITITPNAGGAGGASKILLRGNKSILGNSSPLIVIDGVPMTNNIRNQKGFGGGEGFTYASMGEGSDALSLINPDDIESVNVLKGANAAALYGSVAANGVLMITTKKGREGKLDISVTSNVTFDSPLKTPELQNVYGAMINQATGQLGSSAWGSKIADIPSDQLTLTVPANSMFFTSGNNVVHLRNTPSDNVDDFYRTGVTTNNSVSLSGGTANMRSYISVANSHAMGMMRTNNYNRNSINFRQTFRFFDRINIDGNINYVETITRNRPGGGTILNPIYHLYNTPGNIDMDYYSRNYVLPDGQWHPANKGTIYRNVPVEVWLENSQSSETSYRYYEKVQEYANLSGPMQDWAFMAAANNNPYWILNMNKSRQDESRVYGMLSATIDLWAGFSFQARAKYDVLRYHSNSRQYATTFLPDTMVPYGRLWDSDSKTTDIYTDYLLNYNKQHGDFSVSASAGWVGHTVKGTSKSTTIENATYYNANAAAMLELPTAVNYFEVDGGDRGVTSSRKSSNWDKAYLFTAQVGWKDKIYVDGSYRHDWYRPYRQFKLMGLGNKESFGYFGVGANAIVSSLVKMPKWWNYLKYRVSYSEVGNSIPNISYFAASLNRSTGAINASNYNSFVPRDEKSSSFETGVEMLFFNDRLSFDLTFYRSVMSNLYMEVSGGNANTSVLNSARVRNQGIESTIGYDFKLNPGLRWRTTYNISYNANKILETALDARGEERLIQQNVAGAKVIYKKGGSIGDIYVSDFMRDENGAIQLEKTGKPKFDTTGNNNLYVGNMNSKWQMGWTNTFSYKDFQLSFLINGRIGGKVISLTESYLDFFGMSQRTADARLYAEANNIYATDYDGSLGMQLPDGSGRVVPIQQYYAAVGGSSNPLEYIYSATNFRLRELSIGYTFRDLFGQNKNLSVSFIGRNLFFLYNDSPVDPDISLSTGNGLGGFELYNMPSSRSFGFNLKLNL